MVGSTSLNKIPGGEYRWTTAGRPLKNYEYVRTVLQDTHPVNKIILYLPRTMNTCLSES